MRGMAPVALGLALLACAGSDDLAGPHVERRDGLQYAAELLEAGPETVIVEVQIVNSGGGERRLRFPDPCVALLRFYDSGNRRVWDQLFGNKTCVPPSVEIGFQPGEERTFRRFAYAPVILAHFELPAGRYRVTTYLRPEGEEVVELELGAIDLARLSPFD